MILRNPRKPFLKQYLSRWRMYWWARYEEVGMKTTLVTRETGELNAFFCQLLIYCFPIFLYIQYLRTSCSFTLLIISLNYVFAFFLQVIDNVISSNPVRVSNEIFVKRNSRKWTNENRSFWFKIFANFDVLLTNFFTSFSMK